MKMFKKYIELYFFTILTLISLYFLIIHLIQKKINLHHFLEYFLNNLQCCGKDFTEQPVQIFVLNSFLFFASSQNYPNFFRKI